MRLGQRVGQMLTLTLVAIAVIMVIGQLLGQPVLLSYVETGSMAPTMDPGDGFIAVPAGIAGEVQTGDVVTFEATTLNGGGLTTHRVVGKTEQGYITKGDANPTTDQDGNEPPVTEGQIKAKALQVGGEVVVIPNIGLLIMGVRDGLTSFQRTLATTLGTRQLLGTQGLAYLFIGIGVVAYAGSLLFEESSERAVQRTRKRTGDQLNLTLIIVLLTVGLMALLTAAMVVPGGTQEFGFVSAESDSPGPTVIEASATENITYTVPSTGRIPTVVYLEPQSAGILVTPDELYVAGNEEQQAIIRISAPAETGVYNRYIVEYRYLAVIPQSTIDTLYKIHPWAPIVVIDLLFGTGFLALGFAFTGGGVIRTRSRATGESVLDRALRWLR